MVRWRTERPSGGLLEDLHRQQRQRTLRRAGMFTALGVVLLGAGVGFKVLGDRRDLDLAIDTALVKYNTGTLADMQSAAEVLESSLDRNGSSAVLRSAVAVVR